MSDLQGANWNSLRLAGLLWSYDSALGIEQRALKAAQAMGKRLRGEWVAMSPEEAMLLIAEAATELRSTVADSGMWVRNRNRINDAAIAYREAEFAVSTGTNQGYRNQKYDRVKPGQHRQYV